MRAKTINPTSMSLADMAVYYLSHKGFLLELGKAPLPWSIRTERQLLRISKQLHDKDSVYKDAYTKASSNILTGPLLVSWLRRLVHDIHSPENAKIRKTVDLSVVDDWATDTLNAIKAKDTEDHVNGKKLYWIINPGLDVDSLTYDQVQRIIFITVLNDKKLGKYINSHASAEQKAIFKKTLKQSNERWGEYIND